MNLQFSSGPELSTEVWKPRENQAAKVGKKVVSLVPGSQRRETRSSIEAMRGISSQWRRMPGPNCRLKILLIVTVLCLYCMISTLISVTRQMASLSLIFLRKSHQLLILINFKWSFWASFEVKVIVTPPSLQIRCQDPGGEEDPLCRSPPCSSSEHGQEDDPETQSGNSRAWHGSAHWTSVQERRLAEQRLKISWCRGAPRLKAAPGRLTALASAPGSGNTWLRYLLQQLTGLRNILLTRMIVLSWFRNQCCDQILKISDKSIRYWQGLSSFFDIPWLGHIMTWHDSKSGSNYLTGTHYDSSVSRE